MKSTKHQRSNRHKLPRLALRLFVASLLVFALTNLVFFLILRRYDLQPGTTNAASGDISWRVFDGGGDDPGTNYSESILGTANVSGLKKLWQAALPIKADDAPVEAANVSTGSGTIDLVIVNTIKGNLIAFNAATGAKVWEADPSSADFNGQGTKSSPAIDPTGTYVYAYAVDGYVHRYLLSNGVESSGGGFPAQVTLLPNDVEKGSASLNIANGYLYMTLSGNDGDYGHYDGHVVAVNLSSGTKTVWNSLCSNITQLLDATNGDGHYCSTVMSGIWARPGVKVDPVTGNVFVATGNGNYNASSGGNNWGDSIIELTPNLSTVVDSYTPSTYASLDSSDTDLGSTAPVILPTQSGSNTPYMLVQGGKDGVLRLLNRANLSGQGGPRHVTAANGELQTIGISSSMHEQPAVWKDTSGTTWVYVTDDASDLYAYRVVTSGGVSSLSQAYHYNIGVISSPFVANGVLYFAGNTIKAYNAKTGAKLFDSSSLGISINQHWESPIVVNGTLFTSDGGTNLYALSVPGSTPPPPPTPTPPPPAPTPPPPSGSSSKSSSTSSTTKPGSSTQSNTGSKAAKSPMPETAVIATTKPETGPAVLLDFVRTSFTSKNWPALSLMIAGLISAVLGCYLAVSVLFRRFFRKESVQIKTVQSLPPPVIGAGSLNPVVKLLEVLENLFAKLKR